MTNVEQVFEKMSLKQIVCRLPGKHATEAFKKRINKVNKLADFLKAANRQTQSLKNIKEHINNVINDSNINELLKSMDSKHYSTLYGWLDQSNRNRFLKEGKGKLSIEFLFNLTDSSDLEGMKDIFQLILSKEQPKLSQITSVLNKINYKNVEDLIKLINKDNLYSSLLFISNKTNFDQISDILKIKAVLSLKPNQNEYPTYIQSLNLNLFKTLNPIQRLNALDAYLSYFPKSMQIIVFNPESTIEEFNLLFKDCSEFSDLKLKIIDTYHKIINEN